MNWPRTNEPERPPAGTISLGVPKPAAKPAPAAAPTNADVVAPSNDVAPMFNPAATNLPVASGSNAPMAEFLETNPAVVNLMTTNEITLTNAVTVTNAMTVTNALMVTNLMTLTNRMTVTNAVTLTNQVVVTNTISVTNLPITNFPVTIALDLTHPGHAIPENFMGLSFEASQLLFDTNNGVRYFRSNNLPLLHLFQTLGVKNLRIGGNTSDRDVRQLPTLADIDSLFQFAKAANVKVIYCLRLYCDSKSTPQTIKYDVDLARYIWGHYEKYVDCFSIGQEPSAYPVEKRDSRAQDERMGATNEKYKYSDYQANWKQFAAALIGAIPDIRLCGPSVHNNGEWARNFIRDFGQSNNVVLITEHLYPGGAGGKV
ncbi:MAG TPA: hypothetical protein VN625_01790, partial [Desulfuromonadaceae bacterium]|nr:hypothetical protein [Desulfuromonadaceae bacterium]